MNILSSALKNSVQHCWNPLSTRQLDTVCIQVRVLHRSRNLAGLVKRHN